MTTHAQSDSRERVAFEREAVKRLGSPVGVLLVLDETAPGVALERVMTNLVVGLFCCLHSFGCSEFIEQ